jgi:beta-glucosidase
MADPKLGVSIADGLRARNASIQVVAGSGVDEPLPGGIAAALAAAQASDVVLLALGETQAMSGEAQSRTDIVIPAAQMALADAVAATGKPIVILLRHGRALMLEGAVKDAAAIVATWFLGSQTGHAIADVLFGDVSPSAKLSVSFPHRGGQEPYFYNHSSTGRPAADPNQSFGAKYRETTNEALYPFGHGLSYTRFQISDVSVPKTMTDRLVVTARVTNSGRRAGAEVVQLYIHDVVASRVQPVRALKRFERVTLSPGETKTVMFELHRDDLAFWGGSGPITEPGDFDLWVATSSTNGAKQRFRLV